MKEKQIMQLLRSMTLEQKLGQMSLCEYGDLMKGGDNAYTGPKGEFALTAEQKKIVGGVLNFKDASEMIALQKKHMEEDPNKIPLLFMMDVIHGYKTAFPIPLALACSFDTDLAERCARAAAVESAASGVQITYSPMADMMRDARWGRVMEGFGEDPLLSAEMSSAFVRGYQRNPDRKYEIGSCAKHFACYGAAEAGRDYNCVDLSDYTMDNYYMSGYKACVDAGAVMMMTAFNSLNGVPCTANLRLRDRLRGEWGFDGVVVSDYNSVAELVNHGVARDLREAAKLAIDAECDMEMVSTTYLQEGIGLVESGELTMEQIDRSVYRILSLKNRLGLFENPYAAADVQAEKRYCRCPEFLELARRASAESCVLLKNDGALPLEKREGLALIGPMADSKDIIGAWSCNADKQYAVTVRQALEEEGVSFLYAKGCGGAPDEEDESGFAEAVEAAKNSETVLLCVGERMDLSGECRSRADITVPALQLRLFEEIRKVNPNVVVILFQGRPLDIRALTKAKALFTMWQPGTEGGRACADLLFGKCNFVGKLAMSFPYSVGQVPVYYNHYNTGRPFDPKGNLNAWTSKYIDVPNDPLFSFGYGLSYSRFVCSDAKISCAELGKGEKLRVSVRVRNESDVDGTETVQLYIADHTASRVRPVRELKKYKKVFVPAHTETVAEFFLCNKDLAFAHEDGVYAESGEYSVFVGGDPSALVSLNFVYNAEKMRYNGERIKTGELIKPYAETQSEQQRIL